ncbi:MAG: helix-turn-helix domain-containing protein, partial [bacterium]|nr:helix-turn-helix domain-containing protein [bacterium]
MSDEIYFDGIKYVSANEAASLVGLTRDYIARLCKEGKVLGRRIGKQWYVSQNALHTFILAQEYTRAKRREELVEIRKREYLGAGDVHLSRMSEEERLDISPREQFLRAVPASPLAPADPSRRDTDRDTYIQSALATALARTSAHSHSRGANFIATAPMHAVTLKGHLTHALPPAMDLLHKLSAIAVAILFTVGTYVFVDAQYARVAERSSAFGSSIVAAARVNLAAAANNPMGTLSSALTQLARSFNTRVDSLVYGIMFPVDLIDPSRAKLVTVRVVPISTGGRIPTSQGSIASSRRSSSSGAGAQSIYTEPDERVIERVIETQRIVSTAGGITEELLNQRLGQLDNKLTSQIYSVSAQSSAVGTSVTNVYSQIAQSQRIDELKSVDISNSTFSSGTIDS